MAGGHGKVWEMEEAGRDGLEEGTGEKEQI
jgi:hypothetical protein